MLKLGSIRWRGKCSKHPGYDPYLDGRGAIRGGCERCGLLADIQTRHTEMLALMKRFAPAVPKRRAEPHNNRQTSLFGEIEN